MVAARRLLFALLAAATPAWGGDAALSVEADSAAVEYGKPLHLRLYTPQPEPPLQDIDLAALARDFTVQTRDSVERGEDGQQWRIRLYPNGPGEWTLPPLRLGDAASEPFRVTVLPPRDANDDAPIRVDYTAPSGTVWVNQPLRVAVEVESATPYFFLDSEAPRQPGIEWMALPRQSGESEPGRYRHQIAWLLTPRAHGAQRIHLPSVGYRRDGVTSHRFHLPPLDLEVRPLPAFIPPTLPVGRLTLETALPRRFAIKGRMGFLRLRVAGEGVAGQPPSELLRQFASSSAVRFYPPDRLTGAGADADPAVAHYRIPFTPTASGPIALPSIRLQYFDPQSGKLVTATHPLGRLFVVPAWLAYSGGLLLLLALLAAARQLARRVARQWHRYRAYRTALERLAQADSAAALKWALTAIAAAESWPTNITLREWRRRWLERYPRHPAIGTDLLRLQAWHYGQAEPALDTTRSALVALCYRRTPLLRYAILRRWIPPEIVDGPPAN